MKRPEHTFSFFKNTNEISTFKTIQNNGFDEICFREIKVEGDVQDLHVLLFERYQSEWNNPHIYSLEEFINLEKRKALFILPLGWDLHITLGLLTPQGRFISLENNGSINFPGLLGKTVSNMECATIGDFKISITYKVHRTAMAL